MKPCANWPIICRDTFIEGHSDAALAASVFHFGEIPIPELKQYLKSEGINVRI